MNDNYLQKEQLKFEEIANREHKEANKYEREFSRNLILAASIVIAIISSIISAIGVTETENILSKIIIYLGLSLLFLSIIFGIIQFFCNYIFCNRLGRVANKVVESISKQEVKTRDEVMKKIEGVQKNLRIRSPIWPSITQVFLLLIGFALIMFFVAKILF